jgi:hypothetical protein
MLVHFCYTRQYHIQDDSNLQQGRHVKSRPHFVTLFRAILLSVRAVHENDVNVRVA